MSEETQETVEQEAQPTEEVAVEQPQEQPQEEKKNDLFSSLFDIAEEEEDSGEDLLNPPIKADDIVSLSDAVDRLPDEPQEEVEEATEEPEEVAKTKEEPEEVSKAEPKKKKVKQVIDPDLPDDLKSNALVEQEPQVDPDKDFYEGLLPEEQEVYDLAKYASAKMPEYKGADQQFKKYFTDTRQYIEKRLKEDPHLNLADDDEYKAFIARSRPKFTGADARKVEQEMLLEKAEERARQKLKPEIERVRREQEKINLAPKVAQKKASAQETVKNIIPKEFREIIEQENGIETFAKTKPIEYAAIDAVTGQALMSANLLVDITTGNVPYDSSNQDHVALLDWVNKEQENFIQSGQTQKDGKIFMRRERYYQLPESKRAEYYTWSDDDLLGIIAGRSQEAINLTLQRQQEMLKAYIGQQQPQQQQVAQAPAQPRPQAPKVPSSPRPSPDNPKKVEAKHALFSTLGM